jgi:hypothetical protein
MAQKKDFFKEKTVAEIKELDIKQIFYYKNLHEKISNLGEQEGLELRQVIISNKFTRYSENQAEGSRKHLSGGNYIEIKYPRNLEECFQCNTPREYIHQSLQNAFQNVKYLEECNFLGTYFQSAFGRDSVKKSLFDTGIIGENLFSYSQGLKKYFPWIKEKGIEIQPYTNSKKVAEFGGIFVGKIPSKEQNKSRYLLTMKGIPLIEHKSNLLQILGLNTKYNQMPENILWNFNYNESPQNTPIINSNQEVAMYMQIMFEQEEKGNLIPKKMNPFLIYAPPVVEYYNKLCNNIIIYDHTLKSKSGLRHLHSDEKNILLGRYIGFCIKEKVGYLNENAYHH